MILRFDEESMRQFIAQVVAETVERLEEDRDRLKKRIAFKEHEAAELLGIQRHTLRDARLRGEVEASRLGRRIIYSRGQLLRLLERNRTNKL